MRGVEGSKRHMAPFTQAAPRYKSTPVNTTRCLVSEGLGLGVSRDRNEGGKVSNAVAGEAGGESVGLGRKKVVTLGRVAGDLGQHGE